MKNPNTYQVIIRDGKQPKEYACILYLQLHFWKWNFWYLIKKQRGPLFHICYMATKWAKMLGNCDIIDKTIES